MTLKRTQNNRPQPEGPKPTPMKFRTGYQKSSEIALYCIINTGQAAQL